MEVKKLRIILSIAIIHSTLFCYGGPLEEFQPSTFVEPLKFSQWEDHNIPVYYNKTKEHSYVYAGESLKNVASKRFSHESAQKFAKTVGEITGISEAISGGRVFPLLPNDHLKQLRSKFEEKQEYKIKDVLISPVKKVVGVSILGGMVGYYNPYITWDEEDYFNRWRNALYVGSTCGILTLAAITTADPKELLGSREALKSKKWWWPWSYTDRRSIVKDQSFPWCVHGELQMEYLHKGEIISRAWGSGTLIGGQYVLTAAHNFYSKEENRKGTFYVIPDIVSFFPAKSGSYAPFGVAKGEKMIVSEKYINSETIDFAADIGILKVGKLLGEDYLTPTSINALPGQALGHFAVKYVEEKILKENKLRITGYPGEKAGKMHTMEGALHRIQDDRLFYDIDTTAGQSGSSIYLNYGGGYTCAGVHTQGWGSDPYQMYNSGAHITEKHFEIVQEWVKI